MSARAIRNPWITIALGGHRWEITDRQKRLELVRYFECRKLQQVIDWLGTEEPVRAAARERLNQLKGKH